MFRLDGISKTFLFLILGLSTRIAFTQETGIASYYGPGFHGKQTASGEIFNQNALTAAHRTLSFGSLVEVTNVDTGATVVVRVNDRGPFVPGRIIDLSQGAALAIGLTKDKGIVSVSLKVLSGKEVPKPEEGIFYLQIGAYKTENNAKQTAGKLSSWGFDPKIRLGDLYRVYLGPLGTQELATAEQTLKSHGFSPQKRSTPPPGYE